MKSFEDLTVWQKSMDLVDHVYEIADQLPSREVFGLRDQLTRAVVSIPSNIAEGYGRGSDKDFAHFLEIARGSTNEVLTQLEIVRRRFSIAVEADASLAKEIRLMLNALIIRKRS